MPQSTGADRAPALDGALAARVQSLRERFDMWGTGERPEGFVSPTGKNEQLDSIDRFEFGVRISKGFELGAELHVAHAEGCRKNGGLAAVDEGDDERGRPNRRPKIDLQVNDGTVKISLAISEEGMKKMMAARRGAPRPYRPGRALP